MLIKTVKGHTIFHDEHGYYYSGAYGFTKELNNMQFFSTHEQAAHCLKSLIKHHGQSKLRIRSVLIEVG